MCTNTLCVYVCVCACVLFCFLMFHELMGFSKLKVPKSFQTIPYLS